MSGFFDLRVLDRQPWAFNGWRHEWARAGMVWACRWCGDLPDEDTGCFVPYAVRYVDAKLAELYAMRAP